MAAALEPAEFLAWFEGFMPPGNEREFLPLAAPVDTSEEPSDADPVVSEDPDEQTATEATDLEGGEQAGGEAEGDDEEAADTAAADEEQRRIDEETRALGGKSHLIGLAFIRADAMNRIAAALPAGDPRIAAYQDLAVLHGAMGFEAMFDADYAGSHWIGTFALKYLLSERY